MTKISSSKTLVKSNLYNNLVAQYVLVWIAALYICVQLPQAVWFFAMENNITLLQFCVIFNLFPSLYRISTSIKIILAFFPEEVKNKGKNNFWETTEVENAI